MMTLLRLGGASAEQLSSRASSIAAKRLEKALKTLDTSQDGEIDADEWEAAIYRGLEKRTADLKAEQERRAKAAAAADEEFSAEFLSAARKVFEMIDRRYGPHSVDLFTTRDNQLLDRYVSWRPDPSAVAVDAFLFPLKGENPYCFPPVTCIPRLLREVLYHD